MALLEPSVAEAAGATVDRRGTQAALLLGDQLWLGHPALERLDRSRDTVLMIEAPQESTHVWSHKARIALFLAAMRAFAVELRAAGFERIDYVALDAEGEPPDLAGRLRRALARLAPRRLLLCEPGDLRVTQALAAAAQASGVALESLDDPHFIADRATFEAWAGPALPQPASDGRLDPRGLRSLRMEFFYRMLRQRERILLDGEGKPAGGRWNYDDDNRKPYPRSGPGPLPQPPRFALDADARALLRTVEQHFGSHPGSLGDVELWPRTRVQARQALARFVDERLAGFGPQQDAMWTDTPFGWHSQLSAALNLHLLDPREVIAAALEAWRARALPLASVEGFVRQILGWREFMRGIYRLDMPQMRDANFFGHRRALPRWYWNGSTRMRCMQQVVGQTLRYGYAHHIQRLMVTGNFALLAEVEPEQVCDWYLAVYVDAVDWVERPNTAGMALYALGPRLSSKPYIASGQYIARQSNYCAGCAYDPGARRGERACPVTQLYWRFVIVHQRLLAANPRTALMAGQAARLDAAERAAIVAEGTARLERIDAV